MKFGLSQYENSTLLVNNEGRLSAVLDKRGGDRGDLRRKKKVGKSSFGKHR